MELISLTLVLLFAIVIAPANLLNHACPCRKTLNNPFVQGSELGVLAPLGPAA